LNKHFVCVWDARKEKWGDRWDETGSIPDKSSEEFTTSIRVPFARIWEVRGSPAPPKEWGSGDSGSPKLWYNSTQSKI